MIFKCKICGGSLDTKQGERVTECEYCGVKQTIPGFIEPKTQEIYNRASAYLMNNEFDKAENLYNQILFENKEDADAYWNVLMCRYGVTYVKDPAVGKYIPTCNRTLYLSVLNDENYHNAIHYADEQQKELYIENAQKIDEIQKGILAVSKKEEPFDVFICYKETDSMGRRTQDSVLANELYHQLTQEGFKVFFSRITLEDKLGQEYEPYIFAALNSARVMIVMGTSPEYFDAVWVKNEWSRFLTLIKNGADKILIPAYRDMDPYNLPSEFANLQAQDMSRLGFMQDLIRAIRKIVSSKDSDEKGLVSAEGTNIEAILKRAFMSLNDENFKRADSFAEQALNIEPENPQAYLVKLMASLKIKNQSALGECSVSFENNDNYKKLISFADNKLKNDLQRYLLSAKENKQAKNNEKKRKLKKGVIIATPVLMMIVALIIVLTVFVVPMQKYNQAMKYIEEGRFEDSKQLFLELDDYKDSQQKVQNFLVVPKKIVQISSNGKTTTEEYTYDVRGNVIKSSSTDEYGSNNSTEYSYDKNDNLIREKSSGNYSMTAEYMYDKKGNCTKCTYTYEDGSISTTEYIYDEKGNCIKHVYSDPNEGDSSEEFIYDKNGNCIKNISYYDGTHVSEYVYDNNNNCVKTITTSEIYGNYTYEDVYDNEGHLIEAISDSGKTLYTYDENGNCIKEVNEYSDSLTVTTRKFDKNGNCTAKKSVTTSKANESTSTTNNQYSYDENGNLIKKSFVTSGDSSYYRGGNEYIYDEYNKCVEEISIDNTGERKTTKYDYEYQLIYVSYENNFDVKEITESYINHYSNHISICTAWKYDEDNLSGESIHFMKIADAINYAKKRKPEKYKVYFDSLVIEIR